MKHYWVAAGTLSLAIGNAQAQQTAQASEQAQPQLEEVVVTAARRAQTAQSTSLSIAVLGGGFASGSGRHSGD